MASGWTSGTERDATLRRIAIVLTSLPEPIAQKLLGSIGSDRQQAVLRTIATLHDVDPLERQRAIHAFKTSVHHQSSSGTPNADGDSLQIATDRQPSSTPAPSRRVPRSASTEEKVQAPAETPLSFLADVEETTLANLLDDEHPQTIAFVLASIAPDQAARILPGLDETKRKETLRRIGRLGEIPETAVNEVAEHFRSRLSDDTRSDRQSLGKTALDAIMSAMEKSPGGVVENGSHDVIESAVATGGYHGKPNHNPDHQGSDPFSDSVSDITAAPELELRQRLRVAEGTWPADGEDSRDDRSEEESRQRHDLQSEPATIPMQLATAMSTNRSQRDPFVSSDQIHQHLMQLHPERLCHALGLVPKRVALLALCGLPVHTVESALSYLRRSEARSVRTQMNSLSSVSLREIDQAKETVAEASVSAPRHATVAA